MMFERRPHPVKISFECTARNAVVSVSGKCHNCHSLDGIEAGADRRSILLHVRLTPSQLIRFRRREHAAYKSESGGNCARGFSKHCIWQTGAGPRRFQRSRVRVDADSEGPPVRHQATMSPVARAVASCPFRSMTVGVLLAAIQNRVWRRLVYLSRTRCLIGGLSYLQQASRHFAGHCSDAGNFRSPLTRSSTVDDVYACDLARLASAAAIRRGRHATIIRHPSPQTFHIATAPLSAVRRSAGVARLAYPCSV